MLAKVNSTSKRSLQLVVGSIHCRRLVDLFRFPSYHCIQIFHLPTSRWVSRTKHKYTPGLIQSVHNLTSANDASFPPCGASRIYNPHTIRVNMLWLHWIDSWSTISREKYIYISAVSSVDTFIIWSRLAKLRRQRDNDKFVLLSLSEWMLRETDWNSNIKWANAPVMQEVYDRTVAVHILLHGFLRLSLAFWSFSS